MSSVANWIELFRFLFVNFFLFKDNEIVLFLCLETRLMLWRDPTRLKTARWWKFFRWFMCGCVCDYTYYQTTTCKQKKRAEESDREKTWLRGCMLNAFWTYVGLHLLEWETIIQQIRIFLLFYFLNCKKVCFRFWKGICGS